MTASPSPSEFWFLDQAVVGGMPISLLVSPDLQDATDASPHGLCERELVETLTGLFKKRWICVDDESTFLSSDEILECFQNTGSWETQYYLTTEGGDAWESMTRPDWSLFVDEYYDPYERDGARSKGITRFRCLSRERLEAYCNRRQFGGFRALAEITIRDIAQWSPLYWKALPSGYQARFEFEDYPYRDPDLAAIPRFMLELQAFVAFRDAWRERT